MKRVILVLFLALTSTTVFAAKAEKVDICHFDTDQGIWKLINISGNAVPAHFTNHDDGFPDTTTSSSGTYLDENCEESGLPYCGDCLVVHESPGCEMQACQDYICSYDSFCCTVIWDALCVTEAQDDCQGSICQ